MAEDGVAAQPRSVTVKVPLPQRLELSAQGLEATWRKFKRSWETYELASRLDSQDEKYRAAVFKTCLSDGARDVFEGLPFEAADDKDKITKIIPLFEAYCVGETSEVYETYKFHQRKQEKGETIDTYIGALRQLASSCNFKTFEERMLRDQVVIGLSDDTVREKLLQESGLTLKKCIEICRVSEAAAQQAKSMAGDEALHRVGVHVRKKTNSQKDKGATPKSKHDRHDGRGTRNVIKACQKNNVRNLIYVSNTSVVKSYNSIVSGTEENTSYPKKHLFPDGESRAKAESLVLGANGLVLKDLTSTLRTMCIRPVTLYGELDSYLLPHLVDLAIFNEGHIPCIGSLRSKHHFMYVGNAAWALLCANKAINKGSFQLPTLIPRISQSMTEDVWTSGGQTPSTSSGGKRLSKTLVKPKGKLWGKKLFSSIGRDSRSNSVSLPTVPRTSDPSVSGYSVDVITPPWETYDVKGEGKVYFICDDTPPINFFLFIKPILYRYGYFLTSWSLPEKWAKRIATVVYVVALILYPFIMCNPRVTINDVHHVCRTYTFSDKLARQRLGYMPIFNPKEGMRRTTEFYDNKYKEAMMSHLVDHALSSKHVGMLRRMSMIKRDIAVMDMTDTGRRFRVKRVDSRNKGWW